MAVDFAEYINSTRGLHLSEAAAASSSLNQQKTEAVRRFHFRGGQRMVVSATDEISFRVIMDVGDAGNVRLHKEEVRRHQSSVDTEIDNIYSELSALGANSEEKQASLKRLRALQSKVADEYERRALASLPISFDKLDEAINRFDLLVPDDEDSSR